MIERFYKLFKRTNLTSEEIDFILKPIKDGKNYYIGDISELMDITMEIDLEDIKEIICERNIPISEDLFTIHYNINIDSDDLIIISVHKISPNYAFITGWIEINDSVSLCPVFCIIPTGDTYLDRSDI